MSALHDVLAVDIKSLKVRVISTDKDEKNAAAIMHLAVMRRGVEEEFFAHVPAGKYKDGDLWA